MARTALHISLILSLLLSLASCTTESITSPRGEVSIAYLWSLCSERSIAIKKDLYIVGYVVANDKLGEKNKAIVIDDGSGGIELKVEGEDINAVAPLFSRVMLRCSGLNIGREGGKTVIGRAPTAEYVVDRIDKDDLLNYLSLLNSQNTAPAGESLAIGEIDSHKMLRYVTLSNLQLVDEELGMTWCDVDPYNPGQYQTTVRHFHNLTDTLRVVIDHRCYYADQKPPQQCCTMHGIVDWHDGDIALRITAQQVFKEE